MASFRKRLRWNRKSADRCFACAAAAAALLLAAGFSPAHADPIGGMMAGLGAALFFGALAVLAVFLAYVAVVLLVEAKILNLFLKVGFRRCLGYSTLANVASGVVGWLWSAAARTGGWKLAIVHHQWNTLGVLFVRSYLVAVAVEGLIVLLMVGKRADARTVIKAVAWANAASYVLSVPVLFMASDLPLG